MHQTFLKSVQLMGPLGGPHTQRSNDRCTVAKIGRMNFFHFPFHFETPFLNYCVRACTVQFSLRYVVDEAGNDTGPYRLRAPFYTSFPYIVVPQQVETNCRNGTKKPLLTLDYQKYTPFFPRCDLQMTKILVSKMTKSLYQ